MTPVPSEDEARQLGQTLRLLTVLEDEALMNLPKAEAAALHNAYDSFHGQIMGFMAGRAVFEHHQNLFFAWPLRTDQPVFGWLAYDAEAEGHALYLSAADYLCVYQDTVEEASLDQIMTVDPKKFRLVTDFDEIAELHRRLWRIPDELA